ncbi:hypothetical protein BJF80_01645 [Serinicoccus sp. CUA-874]|uniref:hypothetical protein n=1 Tax=Serinicoccus sp. CUA-874 TaxID=1517939 RepID=UPI0009694D3C|nr:hypothetical protein [Serinicoccus sp. CUA-874]OLT18025.1 hypothetical protein BJF80_01645 [Serinicoccus sp. CUA-874]
MPTVEIVAIVSWERYVARRGGEEYWFRGCFHQITEDRIVQRFTFEGMPVTTDRGAPAASRL